MGKDLVAMIYGRARYYISGHQEILTNGKVMADMISRIVKYVICVGQSYAALVFGRVEWWGRGCVHWKARVCPQNFQEMMG